MKKIRIIFTLLTALICNANAQQSNGYLGIAIGPSIPLGDLASNNLDNDAAGLANTGSTLDITFAYKLGGRNFGIRAMLRCQGNPMDAQALADALAYRNPGVLFTVESKAWSIGGILFGGYGAFPISQTSFFTTRAMIGFLSATSPEITITGTGPTGAAWIKRSSKDATAFSYLLGVGFKFDLATKLCLLANLDYLGSEPEFVNVTTTNSLGDLQKNTWSQVMGILNFTFGVALKFD